MINILHMQLYLVGGETLTRRMQLPSTSTASICIPACTRVKTADPSDYPMPWHVHHLYTLAPSTAACNNFLHTAVTIACGVQQPFLATATAAAGAALLEQFVSRALILVCTFGHQSQVQCQVITKSVCSASEQGQGSIAMRGA